MIYNRPITRLPGKLLQRGFDMTSNEKRFLIKLSELLKERLITSGDAAFVLKRMIYPTARANRFSFKDGRKSLILSR